MTFDEQLRRDLSALAGRLRDEIFRELRGVGDELVAQHRIERQRAVDEAVEVAETRVVAEENAQGRLQAELAAAEARAREQRERHEQAEAQARQALEQADQRARDMVDAAVAASRQHMRATDLAASERLLDAIRAIDRARSLSDILDALVSSAGREAPRAGVLLARNRSLRGWRFLGFGPAFESASTIELPLEEGGVIAEAIRTGTAISADTSGRPAAPPFAALPDGRESLAVPIAISGEIVAVLYADQGTGAEVADGDDDHRPSSRAWPDALELMARHASRCLEAVTAFKAVRVLTVWPDIASRAPANDSDNGGQASQNDEDEAARRYARLLVSEIKLYHEAAVSAGRRERDLAIRLGGEIARARLLYEQGVPAAVRQHVDHFHTELVRTLAAGDASLLGQTAET